MVTTRIRLTSTKLRAPFRCALAADLHGRSGSAALEAIAREKPDFVAVAGDLLTKRTPLTREDFAFLRAARGIAPVFYTPGNHEGALDNWDIAEARATGAVPLVNSCVRFRELCVGGLATLAGGAAFLDRFAAQSGFKLLICHQPERYPSLIRERDIDLTLSGHAHGGQFRFFGRGLFAPGQGIFPKYTSGLYENRLVVSRGLANTAPVPRLNNPTELVVVCVEPE